MQITHKLTLSTLSVLAHCIHFVDTPTPSLLANIKVNENTTQIVNLNPSLQAPMREASKNLNHHIHNQFRHFLSKLGFVNINGLSGSTVDNDGNLWSVSDLKLALFKHHESQSKDLFQIFPIIDESQNHILSNRQLESMAWLGNKKAIVGTEGVCEDGFLRAYVLDVNESNESNNARVSREVRLPLSHWNLSCDPNQGIEGLCQAGNYVVFGIEKPIINNKVDINGQDQKALKQESETYTSALGIASIQDIIRKEPNQRALDLTHQNLMLFKLPNPTKYVRISGLDCAMNGSNLSIIATMRGLTNHRLPKIISLLATTPYPRVRKPAIWLTEKAMRWNTYKTGRPETYLVEVGISLSELTRSSFIQSRSTEPKLLKVQEIKNITRLCRANECNAEGITLSQNEFTLTCDNHYGIAEVDNRNIRILV